MGLTKYMLYLISILAGMGFAFSLQAHIAGYINIHLPLGSSAWFLRSGILLVWLPALIISRYLAKGSNKGEFWKEALQGCPAWMKYTLAGLFLYAFSNFFLSFILPVPSQVRPDSIALHRLLRGFTGHSMAFYGLSMGIFYSAIHLVGRDSSKNLK